MNQIHNERQKESPNTNSYRLEENRGEVNLKLIGNISISLRTVGKSLVNNAVSMKDDTTFC